ncbi:MAG: hypothetical protein GX032_00180, partial [Tenericutes bacterium]|nr:hypothetical protein [Mycoplasmatota bacterium]
ASCATYNNGACTQYKSCPNSSCTCATYKSCANSACGAASCPNSSCSCAWWGNYVESKTYPSSCSASGSAGPNQVYNTCNVNAYTCTCSCLKGASSISWSTTSNRCETKCRSESGAKGCDQTPTWKQTGISTYIKRTYTGSCTSYNSCANASACGYNSCRTSGCGCQTYNSCRAATCGCETYAQGSCATWNSFGSWTTTACTASGTLQCQNRVVYN